jgi:hypothetical protein
MTVVMNFTRHSKQYVIRVMNKKSGAQFNREYDSYPEACNALRRIEHCKTLTVLSYNFDDHE